MNTNANIEKLLTRSEEFEKRLYDLLDQYNLNDDLRTQSVKTAIDIASEHAFGIRVLIKNSAYTSAISIFRLQYEAVVRAVWLHHSATDAQVEKLMTALSVDSQQAASNNTPSFSTMMDSINASAPPRLYQLLQAFRENSWKALNSFVHTGIQALNRSRTGYPVSIIETVIRQSNNLSHIAALIIAESHREQRSPLPIVELYKQFSDCLQLEVHYSSK